MAPYQYQPLDVSKKEIRILHLHPGSRDDPIHISIEHIPFSPSEEDAPVRISKKRIKEIQKDLPYGWRVFSTIEGRPIFFCRTEDEPLYTSWQSPIPTSNEAHSNEADFMDRRSFAGAFEAVSYTWGSARPLSNITIFDVQSPSTYAGTCSVGPNLLEMLIHLRRPETARALWIDAICINQEDPIEKGEQIRRMHDIFKFASRTVIWLGRASDDSTEALRALEHVGKQIEYTSDDYFLPSPAALEKNWWDPVHLIPLNPATWKAIAQVMQRPYFERLWVVQEVQIASPHAIFQCGETEVSWYYTRRAFIRCRLEMAAFPELSSPSHKRVQRLTDYLSRSLWTSDAIFMFRLASDRKCTDPRDKVFAILGLLHPNLTPSIQSSYTLPVRDVYIQSFLAIVHHTCRLGLLDTTNQHGPSSDLPSWVPDLRQPNDEIFKVRGGSYASAASGAHATFQPPYKLRVCGITQGEVKAVSPTITDQVRHSWPAFYELVSSHFPDVTEEECLDWYIWIMTQGNLSERWHGHNMFASLQEAKKIFRQLCAGEEPEVASIYRDWYTDNLTDQQYGRFFVTDRGKAGCGPPTVLPGDKVYVVSGYDYPILLRPTHSANGSIRYNYMGPLYVDGLMEGQAFLGPIPSPWKLIINSVDPRPSFSFLNHQTDEITLQDPRLNTLPQEWHEIEEGNDPCLAINTQHYKHKTTGKVFNSDPRLLPEALETRGVHLETITLV